MSKKLVWSVVVLAALAAGSWYLNALGDVGIPEPTVGPSEGLVAAGVQALDPPAEEADPVSSQPLDRAPLEGQVETGSLRVEVVVRDEGTTAAGMPFELWRFAGERRDVLAWGRTGMDGVASFDELSPGSYFFEVFRGNGTPWQTTPRIVAGQQETRRLEIAPGWNLQGRVVDRYGRPVGGAEVRVEGRSGRPDILLARSEEDGSISASHLAGSVRVWALLPGLQPSKRHQLEERLGTAEIRLVLGEPGSRLAGVVENEHGEPVSGALVFIGVPLHLGSHFEQHELHSLRAEEDGRFEVSWLPPGRIFVGALPADEDHARATGRWVEIGPLGAASVVLGLGDGATLVGQVRDRLTGEPVQGVHVSTSPRDDFGLSAISHVFAETDEEGHYRLEGLIAGTHRVAASHGNFLVEGEVAVVRGQQQRWDIELVRGGSFHVRVLGPDGEPLTRWTIELRRKEPGGWRAQAYALTDTGGMCEFSDLRDGEYMVRGLVHGELVVKDAVAAFERRGLVPDERVVTIRVPSDQMPRARILGRVLDSKGEPVLDADVRLYQEPVYGSATLEVDREGRFKTGLLPPGRYSISAHAPSIGQVYAHGMYEVEADQELDVGDLVLGESSRLEVHLVAEDGFPVTDPVLVLGDPRDVTPGAYDLQADEVDGVYRAEGFEPRQYELRFFAADALPQILTLELLPGDTRRLDLRVQRAHLVVLEIRCAEEIPGRSGMLNGLVTVTDSSGERLVFHRLSGYFDDYENRIERVKLALPPGEYGVDVREFGGRQVQTQIRVSEGTTEPFVIDLR